MNDNDLEDLLRGCQPAPIPSALRARLLRTAPPRSGRLMSVLIAGFSSVAAAALAVVAMPEDSAPTPRAHSDTRAVTMTLPDSLLLRRALRDGDEAFAAELDRLASAYQPPQDDGSLARIMNRRL